MPTERISMRRVRELIRLSEAGLSVRQLAGALRLSVGAVSKYGRALRAAGLTWAVAQTLDDGELGDARAAGQLAREDEFAQLQQRAHLRAFGRGVGHGVGGAGGHGISPRGGWE